MCGSGVESHLLTRPYRSTRRAVVEIAVDVAPLVGIVEIDVLVRRCGDVAAFYLSDFLVPDTINIVAVVLEFDILRYEPRLLY